MAVSRPAPWSNIAHFSRVAVLAGGTSAERDISLQSGCNVVQALRQSGLHVEEIDPRDESFEAAELQQFDLIFLALHGLAPHAVCGKEGRIQKQLDQSGIAYTGSNAAASARSFHTLDAKRRFLSSRLPTPEYALVSQSVTLSAAATLGNFVGYPLVVKPETQCSSLGASLVRSPAELGPAIDRARQFHQCVFLERVITGEKWTIPVLDEMALPPLRITSLDSSIPAGSDQNESTQYDSVCDRDHLLVSRSQQLAVKAVRALGCRGLSCVEIQLDEGGQPWLLQVDTTPDLAPGSIVSRSSAAMGWSMSRLCLEIMASVRTNHSQLDRLRAS
ncbi:D-alanine--D-alanine ligase family protein [Planctomicrobium sp. SH527]|uniref:D-alanine--D-alanine ligase family protein n=1 Tax=Planctomicrobium sp. SH527 TaxID=3448123 RepID=UPI003F5AF157